MRIPLLLAVLGLILVEGLLIPRTVKDFQTLRKMRSEMAPENGRPVSLGPFATYDKDGHLLALTTDDSRWIVPIVIHTRHAASDLQYLAQLRKALPNRALVLVGVCDETRCGTVLQNAQAADDLPIVAYGSYAPLKTILRFDDQNQVLLMNQFGGINKSLPRDSSAEQMAAIIQQEIGQ